MLTHGELLQRVWGPAHFGRSGAGRSITKNLRRKLGDGAENPAYIFNEPRVGYPMPKGEVQATCSRPLLLGVALMQNP